MYTSLHPVGRHKVNLVITGHVHAYERTHPVYLNQVRANGRLDTLRYSESSLAYTHSLARSSSGSKAGLFTLARLLCPSD